MRPEKVDLPKMLKDKLDELDKERNSVYSAIDDCNMANEVFDEFNPQMPFSGHIKFYPTYIHYFFDIVFYVSHYKDIVPVLRKLRRLTGKKIVSQGHDTAHKNRQYCIGVFTVYAYFYESDNNVCAYVEDGVETVPKRKLLCGKKLEAWRKEHNADHVQT